MFVSQYEGRIRVVLSEEDASSLGISFKSLDCSEPDTRLLLRAIFKTATEKIGVDIPSEQLMIEAYPHIKGGGILYFTPFKREKRERLRLKRKRNGDYIFSFSSGSRFLDCIKALYMSESSRQADSRAFWLGDSFLLKVAEGERGNAAIWQAREFCDEILRESDIKETARRHMKALSGDRAILEIGQRL